VIETLRATAFQKGLAKFVEASVQLDKARTPGS
jgi:hypothetical protein